MTRETAFLLIATLFSGVLVIASVLASKIIALGPLYFPAGVLSYSITFLLTDTVSEVWNRDRANRLVASGFATLVVVYGLVQLALRWTPAPFWDQEGAFQAILGATTRIIIASLVAYLASQFHDVWIFHLLKTLFRGRHLWLRNNLSTFLSQTIDTTLFITVAFYGVQPVVPLIVGQLSMKLLIALADTPFVYMLVGGIRRLSPE
ncbi:MAG: queuosine precursor transporter [Fidelibacterota bacterium]